jgi:hypothetical protein
MKFRWTIQDLKTFSNKRMIQALIAERKENLNPYAPLAKRLRELSHWVDTNVRG